MMTAVRKAARPKRWPVHRCIPSGQADWAGQMICASCGMTELHRVHAVDEVRAALALQVDARRIGEAPMNDG